MKIAHQRLQIEDFTNMNFPPLDVRGLIACDRRSLDPSIFFHVVVHLAGPQELTVTDNLKEQRMTANESRAA